jgi:phosphohistidine phosphatase
MMRVYLVQHGEAEEKTVNPERPLTVKGRADVTLVATFLKKAAIRPEMVLHSGKQRAQETAELFAGILGCGSVEPRDGLAPMDPVLPVDYYLQGVGQSVMLVGHLPFMDKLASFLLADDNEDSGTVAFQMGAVEFQGIWRRPDWSGTVAFQMGGVVCLEQGPNTSWSIQWAVNPELLRAR